YSSPGSSYEELMKTRMASNELPDLFTTHGWSVLRYSEYLYPVNDLEWSSRINPQIKSVITDENGQMFVLPLDVDIAGIVYNVEVCEKSGVNVDEIKTWNDFLAACEKIKAAGFNPIHMGGKDSWTIGQFFDWAAPSYFITNEKTSLAKDLLAGKFDEETWIKVASLLDTMVKNGYINADALTADYQADLKSLATGKTAFGFYGNYAISEAKAYNADAKLGMFPIPAATEDDEPTLISGERTAVGVWKDSKNLDQALELLNYLAQDSSVKTIATGSGCSAGLTGIKVELGELQEYLDKYATTEAFPYFDRVYLPSGMWDVMCATGADILAQKPGCVENAAKTMAQNFYDKI
ncbi:MAG: extracellular solute-binding protein, partial [Clostridiales bacterium]|nr:extracellular solute-binding protein [Clostridiales bacterium]